MTEAMATSLPPQSAPSPSPFWCHSCHSLVRIHPSNEHLACPFCDDGFVEEINGVVGSPHPHSPAAVFLSSGFASDGSNSDRSRSGAGFRRYSRPEIMSFLTSRRRSRFSPRHGRILDRLNSIIRSGRGRSHRDWLEVEFGVGSGNDSSSIFGRVQNFFSRRGSRHLSNSNGFGFGYGEGSRSRRLADLRDFLLGPGGDLIIQQLIEGAAAAGNSEQLGPSPASKAAIDAMPVFTISKHGIYEDDDMLCAVCKEIFEVGGEAREMPCKHVYHSECILPWLAIHNSCPICRHEIPSEAAQGEVNIRRIDGEESSVGGASWPTTGNGGERGLAIVGIPGIGVQVRSFMLLGLGANDNVSGSETLTTAPNTEVNNNEMAHVERNNQTEMTNANGLSLPEMNHDAEADTTNSLSHDSDVSMQLSSTYNTSSTRSNLPVPEDNRRRVRTFMSWLRGFNSSRSRSTVLNRSMDPSFTRSCFGF